MSYDSGKKNDENRVNENGHRDIIQLFMLSKSVTSKKRRQKEEAEEMISFQSRAFSVVGEGKEVVYGFVMNHAAQFFYDETMTILQFFFPRKRNELTMLHCEIDENCFSVENGKRKTHANR